MSELSSAVFLDRDGVINRKATEFGEYYVTSWGNFEFLPKAPEGIRNLNELNFHIFVTTNQRGVATGDLTRETLEGIHEKMMKYLEERGAKIDELYVCTHSLDDNCECRKPRTGLFERAAKDYGIDLQVSWVIGDSLSDIEAGQRIGASTVVICSDENHPRDPDSGEPIDADEQASNLLEAADIIKNVTGTA